MMATTTSTPSLQVNGTAAPSSSSVTAVGAVPGKRAELRMNMLKTFRPLPLRHEWAFWHDRSAANSGTDDNYEDQLKEIASISTIQSFWQVFNNTPFTTLPLRDSYRLFKKNVKPIWEDPRNTKGGAWTFRVPKAHSYEFWKEIQMMAIGENLQEVVEKGDDICGVSCSVRFNSHLIMVWNRDGDNQKSIDKILERVMECLPEELKPQPQNYYYKKHKAHKAYGATDDTAKPSVAAAASTST
ncbi:translation initiation factor eIF4e [Terfezia boudieri ATCC MYA-4762]|uniref:Translation initiation factor eIF4e n=1 Tax=Terfezia boudieri ATCC MYA-4762 TaxID=1051890 RepID=A0A3N4LLU5_9PEZI|nr:translation initiation factor eIF4e [Terfezia boudieri ATCC MYA-4762]